MHINNQPLVSVLLPSFNHEKYIKDAILSVMNQTYPNIELIVIDDGSTDNSCNIIEKMNANNQFKFISRKNKGLISTLEELKKLANGKYISLFSSDDMYKKNKIEMLVNFLENNNSYSMAFSKVILIDSENNETHKVDENYIGGDIFKELLMGSFFINGLSALIKKEVFDSFTYGKLYIDDLQMWLKIAQNYKIGFINEYLAYYRKHDNHLSGDLLRMLESEEIIINAYQHSKYYNEAINEWNLRWFHNTSVCHKKEAVSKYLLRVLKCKNFMRLKFYKAIIRLLIPCRLKG